MTTFNNRNNITIASTPKTNINVGVRVGIGVNNILSPVSAYNVSYSAIDTSLVQQKVVRLGPTNTYHSPEAGELVQFLVINTSAPVKLTLVSTDGFSYDVTVNSLFVLDSQINNYNLINMGTTTALVTMNVYSTLTHATTDMTYQGSAFDSGVYDASFVKSLAIVGTGVNNTFTVNVVNSQYSFYAYSSDLGYAQFRVNGFSGGYELLKSNINVNGVLYSLYRSENSGLGTITVDATGVY